MGSKWKRGLGEIADGLLSLIFPRAANCLCCGDPRRAEWEDCLCPSCRRALDEKRIPPQACNRCLSPVKAGRKCDFCSSREMEYIEKVYAPWCYTGEVRGLIHAFKFNACDEVLPLLGAAMADALPDREFDCIVPVPLHPKRLRYRGVNQALMLAQALSLRLNIPVREALKRVHYHKPQSRLSIDQRRFNVAGAFSCREDPRGLRILLLDDVRTSGNTAHFCARALMEGGAESVSLITAAVVYRRMKSGKRRLNEETDAGDTE